jgi:hypothetical protein
MTANRCQATTRDGTPCQAYALAGSDYCFHHDPARAAERRQARSKGGRARHGRRIGPVGQAEPVVLDTMVDVAALLERAINETLQLENSIQRARTLGYLANLYIKALRATPFALRGTRIRRALDSQEDPP